MTGNNSSEIHVVHGKHTSNYLRWTLGLGVLVLWGGLCAYVGFLASAVFYTGEVNEALLNYKNETEVVVEKEEASKIPVVIYPNFVADHISDIFFFKARVVEPIIDYYSDPESEYAYDIVAILIERIEIDGLETFTVKRIGADGTIGSNVLYVTDGVVDWWIPECLDGCVFTESFLEKHPSYKDLN